MQSDRENSPSKGFEGDGGQMWNTDDVLPLRTSCDFETNLMLRALDEGERKRRENPFTITTLQVNDTKSVNFGAMQIEVSLLHPLRIEHLEAVFLGSQRFDYAAEDDDQLVNGPLLPKTSTVVFFPAAGTTRDGQLKSFGAHGLVQAPHDQGVVACYAVVRKALEAGMSLTRPHPKDWTNEDRRGFALLANPIQTLLFALCEGRVWAGEFGMSLSTDLDGKLRLGITRTDSNCSELVFGQFSKDG